MSADDVLRELARLLLPYFAAASAEIEATTTSYTTEPGHWPRGARSRRHARDLIRRVPGHVQIGAGAATQWSVSVAAYRAHHNTTNPTTAPALTLVPSAAPMTAEDIAAKTLATMQLRPTKKTAGTR